MTGASPPEHDRREAATGGAGGVRTMIGAREALDLVLHHAQLREPREMLAAESLGLDLVRAVVADRDYPPFDRSVMDGFAVRLTHAARTVRIGGEARPGLPPPAGPEADACVEIMTGAPCPAGTEAVVMKEEVRRSGSEISFPPEIRAGQNIVRAGTECRAGSVILPEGTQVTPLAQGLLAAVGQRYVSVRPRPSLALLITGDELVQAGARPESVEIRDSNGPMLSAMARAHGIADPTVVAVRDTPEALASALDAATADIVVLTGGVSAGNYDLVPAALVAHGATVVFHKVRQQPGKPILFAFKGHRLFFGLPGTPLGCHLGFHRYVLAAVRAVAGLPETRPVEGTLSQAWSTKSDRQQFVLARAEASDGTLRVAPLVAKGSSDLFTVASANAYLSVPEGTRELAAEATVAFAWLDAVP